MNVISITGRLVRDPETKTTQSGMTVTRFTVAVARPGTKDKTDFLPCVVFDREADFAGKYFKKGSFVGVQGKMVSGSYQNKDGQTVYTIELYADRVGFEGGSNKKEETSSEPQAAEDDFAALEEETPF